MSKLRWDCQESGCRMKCRTDPGILVDEDSMVRRCSPTDIDAYIEVAGHHLFIETKGSSVNPPRAQLLAFERLVALAPDKITVLLVTADGNDVRGYRKVTAQGKGRFVECDLAGLRVKIAQWAERAESARDVRAATRVATGAAG